MIPITFLVISPIMAKFAELVVGPISALASSGFKPFLCMILSLVWPLLVLFGAHGGVYMAVLGAAYTIWGNDPICLPTWLSYHCALGMTAIMYGLLSENEEQKGVGFSTAVAMLFGTVSEPALFSICVKDSRYMKAMLCGSAIGGLMVGLIGVINYIPGSASLVGIPFFIGEGSPLWHVLLVIAIDWVAVAFFCLLFTKKLNLKKAA